MKTYSELLNKLDNLLREIDIAREQEAQRLSARALELLLESGNGDMAKNFLNRSRRRAVSPKYWNPKTGATWSGRGKTPKWLVGQDISQYRISDPGEID